jgi:outer membrane lipoprotein SlyB
VEKSARSTTVFRIVVRYDDGGTQVFSQRAAPAWRKGDRVRVIDGRIVAD